MRETAIIGEINTHEFDSNLLIVEQVRAFENHTKRTLSNLLSYPVVYADDVGRRGGHCDGSRGR